MTNVVDFPGVTYLDLPADKILEGAKDKLEGVIVMGYTKDGNEYFASSYADGGDALWLMERFKMALLSVPDEEPFA